MKDGFLTWREILNAVSKFPDEVLDDIAGAYSNKNDMIHPFTMFYGVKNEEETIKYRPFLELQDSSGFCANLENYEEFREQFK